MARGANPFFEALKSQRHSFEQAKIVSLFQKMDRERLVTLCNTLAGYIGTNVPAAFEKRGGLSDYRTNPYVLMTAASVTNLDDPTAFATFLFNSKLYMALETSFGKSIEAAFVGQYPIRSHARWTDPPEKLVEFGALKGLNISEYALIRDARDVMADAANALDSYEKTAKLIEEIDRRVVDVLMWMDERGRNSRSFGSHADAYEIAARRLREALSQPHDGEDR